MPASKMSLIQSNGRNTTPSRFLAIACWLLSIGGVHACYGASLSNSPEVSAALDIPHAIHIIGLGDLKSNISGDLKIDNRNLIFVTAGATTEISEKSIFTFTVEESTVPLIKGATGRVVGFAPYGAGMAVNMVRTAVDTFSLVYRDNSNAIHGVVLLLPRGQGQEVVRTLAGSGLTPREYPRSRSTEPVKPLSKAQLKALDSNISAKPAIKVALLTETSDGVPAAVPVAIYEELISRLANTGLFSKVWREGDTRLAPNALTLDIDIKQFKKGNERTRSLIPYWGSTVLKTDVKLENSGGDVLLEKEISDSINFHGENTGAGQEFCKKITKELKKLPAIKDPKPHFE